MMMMTKPKIVTELEVLQRIPDRVEGEPCKWQGEDEYHIIMFSKETNSLKCGTCYLRATLWADLHPDKVKIIEVENNE